MSDDVSSQVAPAVQGGKLYTIALDGFEPHSRIADTAGKARWADFCCAREAGYFQGRDGFREYLSRVVTLHHGNAPSPTLQGTGASPNA